MSKSLNHARKRKPSLGAILVLAGLFLIVTLSCSVGEVLVGSGERDVATATRTAWATFTPIPGAISPLATPAQIARGTLPPGATAVVPQETNGPGGGTSIVLYATPTSAASETPSATARPAGTSTPAPPTPTPAPTPYVVVSGASVNGRRGPATTFELIGQARQGESLMLMARTPDNGWWQVCCISNQPAWVAADMVTAQGAPESVPALTPPPTPMPTATTPPTMTPTPAPTPLPPFDLARGPEFPIQRDNGIVTMWIKVYEGTDPYERPLPGYVLKVFRNDVDVSSPEQSHAKESGFDTTAPSEGGFEYNLKFEMYGGGEAEWRVYLARPDGSRVSRISEFTTMGDSYRNLVVYIAYFLAR